MLKTNKSVAKRVKITKSGKLLRKAVGGSTLKSRHRKSQRHATKRTLELNLKNKDKSRVLAGKIK